MQIRSSLAAVLAAGLVLSVGANPMRYGQCTRDDCLWEVEQHYGLAECTAYLHKTVTHAAHTVTVTHGAAVRQTATTTMTVIDSVATTTATETSTGTASTMVDQTITSTITSEVVTTEIATVTSTVTDLITTGTVTTATTAVVGLKKRSAQMPECCHNTAAFVSACSCAGVCASTTTVGGATHTVTATGTAHTVTVTATATMDAFRSTDTIVTIVSSTTTSTIVSTVTDLTTTTSTSTTNAAVPVTVDTTVTVDTVATVTSTVQVCAPFQTPASFYLAAYSNSAGDTTYNNAPLSVDNDGSGDESTYLSTGAPSTFSLSASNGQLSAVGRDLTAATNDGQSVLFFVSAVDFPYTGDTYMTCSLLADSATCNGILSCKFLTSQLYFFGCEPGQGGTYDNIYAYTSPTMPNTPSCHPVTLFAQTSA